MLYFNWEERADLIETLAAIGSFLTVPLITLKLHYFKYAELLIKATAWYLPEMSPSYYIEIKTPFFV